MDAIFLNTETNARVLYDKGFVKTIAEIMSASLDNNKLCLDSSIIIGSVEKCLTTEHDFTSLYADLKYFDLILNVLEKHMHDAIICENMTRVLSSFLANSEDQSEALKEEFIDADGITAITSVLSKHYMQRNIAMCCVSVLKEMKGKPAKL